MSYDLREFHAPRLSGAPLRAFVLALERAPWLVSGRLMRDAGIERFRRATLSDPPSVRPELPRITAEDPAASDPAAVLAAAAALPAASAPGFSFEDTAAYEAAYREGRLTPVEVAERLLAALGESEANAPPLRLIVAQDPADLRAQAEASAARHARGAPLSPLDGVPVAIKDELDQRGYRTRVGTAFISRDAREDASVVARLRAAGALLYGKANMHEIGIGNTGLNPHHGTARNPYGLGHHTGGSSSGSAACVAAGLGPLAVGADGGGSIRTPAALCGLVGLKATFGRISEHGAFPLCWSVAHVGPIGATVRDVALGYALLAGVDPLDPQTRGQPAPTLAGAERGDLQGVRVGVYRPWFEDATPEVVAACRAALALLEAAGAEVIEVELPDLELARVAHAITIASEMASSMDTIGARPQDHALDVRVPLALARLLSSRDYVQAQRARTRFARACERVYEQVDLVATPSAGSAAPPIPSGAALRTGQTDLATTVALMRFVFPANLNGYPALTVPAGYDAAGLPLGLHLMGRPWEEALLLRAGAAVERAVERRAPAWHRRLLS
ncbi:MAG: amidase [Planctomycetota bacterium]